MKGSQTKKDFLFIQLLFYLIQIDYLIITNYKKWSIFLSQIFVIPNILEL